MHSAPPRRHDSAERPVYHPESNRTTMSLDPARASATALVWDWPLRAFHWALVLAVAGSFATHYAGMEWFDWHRRCGYVVVVLVGFRLAWGFAGPRYARFASFLL